MTTTVRPLSSSLTPRLSTPWPPDRPPRPGLSRLPAVDLLARWRASGRQHPREMGYIVRHGTRSLVKTGHPRALRLVGIEPGSEVAVRNVVCSTEVLLGQALEFSFDLVSTEDTDLIVDYAIGFPGPTGRRGRKLCKLRRLTATAGEPVTVGHRHLLRAGMTTRRIMPGSHQLDILVNGRPGPPPASSSAPLGRWAFRRQRCRQDPDQLGD